MNQFLNPVFLGRLAKSYLFDINRLRQMSPEELRNYQDKQLRRKVDHAYKNVVMYHDLYKKAGVHPSDISSTKDLQKLPTISKHDIADYYPDGIIPKNANKDQLVHVSTSGTTGKSLQMYVDMTDIAFGLFAYIRKLREWNISMRKNRLSIIADFAPHTVETGYINKGLSPQLNLQTFFKNIQWLNTNDPPEKIIKQLNEFQPDFVGGYYGMLGHLALLKLQGKAPNLDPSWIATTGTTLDPTMKRFLAETFNASVFESYGSTETGALGFTCPKNHFHLFSDLVVAEFFRDGVPAEDRVPSNLVVTKLYGGGTPIIRYSHINDIVDPIFDEVCSCGLPGQLVGKVWGRDDLSLLLPNNRAALPSVFSEIFSKVLSVKHSRKLLVSKIIQKDLHHVEIQICENKEVSEKYAPSMQELAEFLRQEFSKRFGQDVEVTVSVVLELASGSSSRVESKIDRKNYRINSYI